MVRDATVTWPARSVTNTLISWAPASTLCKGIVTFTVLVVASATTLPSSSMRTSAIPLGSVASTRNLTWFFVCVKFQSVTVGPVVSTGIEAQPSSTSPSPSLSTPSPHTSEGGGAQPSSTCPSLSLSTPSPQTSAGGSQPSSTNPSPSLSTPSPHDSAGGGGGGGAGAGAPPATAPRSSPSVPAFR
jgi:hypothetical protein